MTDYANEIRADMFANEQRKDPDLMTDSDLTANMTKLIARHSTAMLQSRAKLFTHTHSSELMTMWSLTADRA